jgi:hypothetical protein
LPHAAHVRADIDPNLPRLRLVRCVGRGNRPRGAVEQRQKSLRGETRPRGIDMAVAARVLGMREETLWHNKMQIVL